MGLFWALFFSSWLTFSAAIETKTFIIRVENNAKPSIFPTVDHWYSSTLRSHDSNPFNSDQTEKEPKCLHIYRTVFHGFSAKLSSKQAEEIKNRPGIMDVIPDRVHQLHTTRSPQFLGLTTAGRQGLLAESDFGSNLVIGILDTGIWPEHESFHDRELGPIPTHWKGECVEGKNFTILNCNKKLVGARYFPVGYEAGTPRGINETVDFRSARDSDGHGTHTASTAAGRQVPGASVFGYASGSAVGIAPKARLAVYKICWSSGCFDSDILAAFDKAVDDGVDVVSLSIGAGAVPYYADPIAMGSFGATQRGVFVSASAGNDGPGEMTVTNISPWITTVGAGTVDRNFPADILLENGMVIPGVSLYRGESFPANSYLPLVYAGNASVDRNVSGGETSFSATFCFPGSLDPELVRGKIVLCERGSIPRVTKGAVVKEAGGAGMILANISPDGEGVLADSHVLPTVAIGATNGYTIQGYMVTTQNPRATFVFHGTQLGVKPAPIVASFSARGPNAETPYVIKPDVVAPGVNILAAWPQGVAPTGLPSDTRRTQFNILSGTSMACPHVSGLAALLKGAHPDWSPASVRSALMTSAYLRDTSGNKMIDESSGNVSTTWELGSGYVDPEKAVDPGLVYDLTVEDYLQFLCETNYTRKNIHAIARRIVNCTNKSGTPWDLNYPSVAVYFDQSTAKIIDVHVRRTVTNVAEGASSYSVSVTEPAGTSVSVQPEKLEFGRKGEKLTYVVRITAESVRLPAGKWKFSFGMMTWTDGRHVVSSPIAMTWKEPF